MNHALCSSFAAAVFSMAGCQAAGQISDRAPAISPPPAGPAETSATQPGSQKVTTQSAQDGAADGTSLALEAVLNSVVESFPLLLAVEEERNIAAGQVLSAEGGFDPRARADLNMYPQGFYRYDTFNSLFEQPTPFYGITPFVGYRWGRGDFPDYYGNLETDLGGEVRAGFKVPLLQGGPIDERRVNLLKAQISKRLAEPLIQLKRIAYLQKAAWDYWKWVGAGRKLDIARRALRIAEDRQGALRRRVEQGDLPAVDLINNEQLIAQREAAVVAAERSVDVAAIQLSLFLRDTSGQPRVPAAAALPGSFPTAEPPKEDRVASDVAVALEQRPELAQYRLVREQTRADLALAENKLLPKLDFSIAGSQDYDRQTEKKDKSEFELEAKVAVEMPLLLRDARGKVRETRGKLAKLDGEGQFAKDQIISSVQTASANVAKAYKRLAKLRASREAAERIEDAERRSFDLGNSTILNVQLREQGSIDAAGQEVDGWVDFYSAQAEYRAALGADGSAP